MSNYIKKLLFIITTIISIAMMIILFVVKMPAFGAFVFWAKILQENRSPDTKEAPKIEYARPGDEKMKNFDYQENINKEVTIYGVAENTDFGAIILTINNIPVYLEKISKWERSTLRQTLEVKGILRKQPLGNSSLRSDVYIIESPMWQVMQEENSVK